MLKLVGYSDRLSVAPGEEIAFKVSADGLETYDAAIVRLIHGDANPDGPGFKARPVDTDANGPYPGRRQEIHAGSYVLVPDHPALSRLESFTMAAMIWPTRPGHGAQAVVAKGREGVGLFLGLDAQGCLSLTLEDGKGGSQALASGKPMLNRHWYLVAATFDATSGGVTLLQRAADPLCPDRRSCGGHRLPADLARTDRRAADHRRRDRPRCRRAAADHPRL